MSDVRTSKYLSLVLRHAPERAGVQLDEAGWVGIDELLAGAAANGRAISRAELDRIVATNPKRRFAFDETGTRIRAVQGHSVEIDLGYEPREPPPVLFHGTHPKVVDAIRTEGLRPMSRRHVHLSADVETAKVVGARRGRPVIVEVDAAAMAADGVTFFRAANGVWLCDRVAPRWLSFPSD